MPFFSARQVEAADEPILDGSKMTKDSESIGYDTKMTRGDDLLTGYSK